MDENYDRELDAEIDTYFSSYEGTDREVLDLEQEVADEDL